MGKEITAFMPGFTQFVHLQGMKWTSPPRPIWILLGSCLLLHGFSYFPAQIEAWYATGFYPYFSRFLRAVFRVAPFSIGDWLYGGLVLLLGFRFFRFIWQKWRKKPNPTRSMPTGWRWVRNLAVLYLLFNLFWGLNYNRLGVEQQLGLKLSRYSRFELNQLNGLLLRNINQSRQSMIDRQIGYPSTRELYAQVAEEYNKAAVDQPFLRYATPCIKSSLWGWVGNYTGFTGYYNPFTGEAQVNSTVPRFLQPFIAFHEVGHQLGYAKEMEANFVGYLAARGSSNPLFRYSTYLDMFLYANRSLYLIDSAAARNYRHALIQPVKDDLLEWQRFNEAHRSFLEPLTRWMYGWYLKGNQQPQGILSYDEVTGFLIAHYRKFGYI